MIIGRILALLLLTTVFIAGCSTLPDPIITERVGVPYAQLAACAFQRVSRSNQTIQFKDLRAANTAVITSVISNTPIWEAKIVSDSPTTSRVDIQAFPTIWGPAVHAQEIHAAIRACASEVGVEAR